MTNLLLVLYDLLFNNFFLALVVFTALTRLIMLPLSIRQQRSMARTQEMQPQIQAIQKKYRSDPAKMQEEFQKIGYNPTESLTGCLPLVIQMPIFFGLYRAINFVLATTPQSLYQLSERAYDAVNLTNLLPIDNSFAWLNLAQPDPLFILPILVGGSMYLQQKLITPQKKDDGKKKKDNDQPDPTAQVQQSMQVTMPLMFGFFALNFPAGLSIYFVISNLIGIAQGLFLKRTKEADAKKNGSARKPKPVRTEEPDLFQKSITSDNTATASENGSAKKKSKKKKKK